MIKMIVILVNIGISLIISNIIYMIPFFIKIYLGVSENVVYPIVPNGFADHYPVMKNG